MTAPRFTAGQLAQLLGLPAPTPEQEAVITAPLGPGAVIAGAGSGKTETMVSRVVWLVANGQLQAERVLGLTFTTKAAAELGGRLRARLAHLRSEMGEASDGEPTVLTYHSYAARLVGEHALRLAVEPSARLLTPAATWQVAEKVVREYDGDLPDIDLSAPFVVSAVLDLAGELSEHLQEPATVRNWTERFIALTEAPPRKGGSGPYADVAKVLKAARGRLQLLPLVERYQQAKRTAGTMDFGDQLAIAARVALSAAEVGRIERSRYDAVLLDEYQDTSHAQLVLLQSLFADGYPLTAVGDPCQSIYGWRGASAGNLTRFGRHFPPALTLPLTTSFRNGARVLDVANAISDPLRADVGVLTPGPNCGTAEVQAALVSTVDQEAEWLAGQIEQAWNSEPRPSVAVLARRRASFSRIDRALRDRGIPVELVGLGGLLATPEVRDVVSTLQVLSDPSAGTALIRLLTGARWRIGPRDLNALGNRARRLARSRREERDGAPPEPTVSDPVEDASIVEALDDLGDPGRYSGEGFRRLDALRRELRDLRTRTGAALPELVADIERTLGLDVEVVASGGTRAHLDRFLDVTAAFAEDAEVATLGSFIAYLAAAEAQERGLEAGEIEVAEDRVQILTVHAAKGLEWDVVAVPGLTKGVFPDRDASNGGGWTRTIGALPYPLRGDAGDLPQFDPAGAEDQKELRDRLDRFAADTKERGLLEERRLAYVAVTRARSLLLCSGYWWDDAVRPRGPAEFLTEISQVPGVKVMQWADEPEPDTANPLSDVDKSVPWPIDPLGTSRVSVESGAELVRAAMRSDPEDGQAELFDAEALEWEDDVTMLLAERARPHRTVIDVPMPEQLSVSALVTLRRDPALLARRIRRPMPAEPAPLARRGTAFHAWLEARFGGERLLDIDELPGAADDGAAGDADLELLQEAFLGSAWSARTPIEVEVPFEARIGELLVRGRMDAVFADDDGGFTVVDWKTGKQPSGAELRAATVQLAAYRLAWAQLRHVPVDQVRAAFHYVRTQHTVAPADLMDADALAGLVAEIAVVE